MNLLNVSSEKTKVVKCTYNKIDKSKQKKKEGRQKGRENGIEGSSDEEKGEGGRKEEELIYFITFKSCLDSV